MLTMVALDVKAMGLVTFQLDHVVRLIRFSRLEQKLVEYRNCLRYVSIRNTVPKQANSLRFLLDTFFKFSGFQNESTS